MNSNGRYVYLFCIWYLFIDFFFFFFFFFTRRWEFFCVVLSPGETYIAWSHELLYVAVNNKKSPSVIFDHMTLPLFHISNILLISNFLRNLCWHDGR